MVVPAAKQTRVAIILCLAVATMLVMPKVIAQAPFGVYDEWTHVDYAYQLAHGHLIRAGDPLSRQVLDDWACRGWPDPTKKPMPPCGIQRPPSEYPFNGQSYNYQHPPLYYAITGLLARPISALTGASFLDVARSLGTLWLAAAMLMLYSALRVWGVRYGIAVAGALLMATTTSVLFQAAYVGDDASGPLCGAAAVYVLARILIRRDASMMIPVSVAAVSTAMKPLNSVALLAVAMIVFFAARGESRQFRGWLTSDRARLSLAIVVSVLGVYGAWTMTQFYRSPSGNVSPLKGASTRPLHGLASLVNWLPTITSGPANMATDFKIPALFDTAMYETWRFGFGLVVTAAALLCIAVSRARSAQRLLGVTALVGSLCYPLAVQSLAALTEADYFPYVPGRYGISVIPLAIACVVVVVDQQRWDRLAQIGAAVGVVTTGLGTLGT